MKKYLFFSIIELMTVILVILLLISLLIPIFPKIKMNARNSLCKNQLRQLGILFTSYSTEHNGYLPNGSKLDIPPKSGDNHEFYEGWHGHLLPYIDSGLLNYHRGAKLRKDGEIFTEFGNTINPADKLKGGWAVISDACYKGGFNELKIFICPEIHANTYDVGASNDFNGLKIPRVSQMSHESGFTDMGSEYLRGMLPTTYIANDVFFGFDRKSTGIHSMRLDEISSISHKAFVVEGGLGWAKGTNGEPGYVYYRTDIGDLGIGALTKAKTGSHKLNYVHDTKEAFWILSMKWNGSFPKSSWSMAEKTELATKFNNTFSGKASMVQTDFGYNIVSFIYPEDGKVFDSFFLANPPGMAYSNFLPFDEPEYHYLVGNMNILLGDGSSQTKDQTWLSMNRHFLGQLSQE